jgi:hypothetical protein
LLPLLYALPHVVLDLLSWIITAGATLVCARSRGLPCYPLGLA